LPISIEDQIETILTAAAEPLTIHDIRQRLRRGPWTHEQVRQALQRVQRRVAIESRPGPRHNDPWTWALAETAGIAEEGN
jgi:chromosome segregation and condensation protein ScpB